MLARENRQYRTDKMLSIRLKVPSLGELCWEKLLYLYAKRPNDLRNLGLPANYLARLKVVNN